MATPAGRSIVETVDQRRFLTGTLTSFLVTFVSLQGQVFQLRRQLRELEGSGGDARPGHRPPPPPPPGVPPGHKQPYLPGESEPGGMPSSRNFCRCEMVSLAAAYPSILEPKCSTGSGEVSGRSNLCCSLPREPESLTAPAESNLIVASAV